MTSHMVEIIGVCERRVAATIAPQQAAKETKQYIKSISKSRKTPLKGGFRPNSPQTQNHLLKSLTAHEKHAMLAKFCQKHLDDLLQREKLIPVATPALSDIQQNTDESISYVAQFEIFPDIAHVKWDNVQLEKLEAEITDTDIDNALQVLKTMRQEENREPTREEATQWIHSMIEHSQRQRLRAQAVDTLIEQNTLSDLPKHLFETRCKSFKEEAESKQTNSETPALTEDEIKEKARRNLTFEALMNAYIKEHHIELDQKRLEAKLLEFHNMLNGDQKTINHMVHNTNLMYRLYSVTLEEQVIDHLLDNVTYTTKPTTCNDMIGLSAALQHDPALTSESQTDSADSTEETVQ